MQHPIVTRTARFTIDPTSERDVIDHIVARSGPLPAGSQHLIVTPNMNHLAMLQSSVVLGAAYRRAHMHLADGWPVVRLARLMGVELAGRTTGSGIVAGLTKARSEGGRLFLIGGSTAEANRRAADRLRRSGWIVRSNDVPQQWLSDEENVAELAREVAHHRPDVVLIGIGSPKQEALAMRLMDATLAPAVFIGVGAGIDFLAGEVPRAPHWMRAMHVEFLHRIFMEPSRMLKRSFGDVPPYLMVVLQSVRASRAARSVASRNSERSQTA